MHRLLFIMLFALAFTVAGKAASGKIGSDIRWELNDGVLTITGTGEMKNFGKNNRPFRTDLVKKLVIGEGVVNIGDNLCNNCGNLTIVEIPSTITHVGKNAFANCRKLMDIRLPYGTETIGSGAFLNCASFIEIDLPISLRSIGENAFSGCENMTIARLSPAIESIGKNAFSKCNLLTELYDLPQYVTMESFLQYGFNRATIRNYWLNKKEIAAKYNRSASHTDNTDEKAPEAIVSDVDIDIPFTGKTNSNSFALIITNENYGTLSNVPYALNDGESFALYCYRTLGIPEKNILHYRNATYGTIKSAFSDLRLINQVVGDDMKLIVFYAGHGAPDDATLEPFMVPVDAARINKDVCIPLRSIYNELGAMKLKSVTMFLDACFSGAARDGSMLVSARGIARVPKTQELTGKIAVFSATNAEETAMPYNEQGHGLFTYYLLKRLKETEGNMTLLDLKEYLTTTVERQSAIINRKKQTPSVHISPKAYSEWTDWRLND